MLRGARVHQILGDSMASFGEALFGSPAKTQQFNKFTPQQQNLQNQSIEQAMGLLQGVGQNKFDFAPIEQQARNQFQTQTVPGLAERFTGMGNNRRSSGFENALSSAGIGLEGNLAALRSQYGLQQQSMQQNLLSSLMGQGLQPSFDTVQQQATPGAFHEIAGLLLKLLPMLL
jgi:hypothetical protein